MLKLNIYQEGDFFVPHRDTPLSEDSIGSLVIALPVAHRGGHLKVTHREWTQRFAFDEDITISITSDTLGIFSCYPRKELLTRGIYALSYDDKGESYFRNCRHDCPEDTKEIKRVSSIQDRYLVQCGIAEPRISYAAFYGDCIHEIESVTMGMRLTLSYQLIRCTVDNENNNTAVGSHINNEDPNVTTKPVRENYVMKMSRAALQFVSSTFNRCGNLLNPVQASVSSQLTLSRALDVDTNAMQLVSQYVNPMNARSHCKALCRALVAALNDQSLAGQRLGFACYHLYESEEELPKDLNNGDSIRQRLNKLRGADALLCLTALQAGFHVELLRLITVVENGMDDCDDDSYADKISYGIERNLPSIAGNTYRETISSDFYRRQTRIPYRIEWVNSPKGALRTKIEEIRIAEYAGYFGNEANCGYVYAQCVIIIRMPHWDSVARLSILRSLLSDEMLSSDDFQGIPRGSTDRKMEKQIVKETYQRANLKIKMERKEACTRK